MLKLHKRPLRKISQKCRLGKKIHQSPYEGQLHRTLKPEGHATRNPYLNYFRQFYSKRGGKVVEAAVQAGANWRKMSCEQRAPYIKAAKEAPYVIATRIKRLMRIATRKNIYTVQKLLDRWTKQVYKVVIKETPKIC